jgi:arsenate reductase-like glutaredoxin family protein
MEITIIGTKKCKGTQRAVRFFRDRGMQFHFRDFTKKPLSQGELKNIFSGKDPSDWMQKGGKAYKKNGLQYKVFDVLEELEKNNDIIVTPIIRFRGHSSLGIDEEIWQKWIKELKG